MAWPGPGSSGPGLTTPSPSAPWCGGVVCTLSCRQCGFLSKVYSLLIKPVSLFWVSLTMGTILSFVSCWGTCPPPWPFTHSLCCRCGGHGHTLGFPWPRGAGRRALVPSSLGVLAVTASRSRVVPRAGLGRSARGPSLGHSWIRLGDGQGGRPCRGTSEGSRSLAGGDRTRSGSMC